MSNYGKCVKWRQTGSCSPTGPREPGGDKKCNIVIESGWSGYCEYSSGKRAMEKGCGEACTYTTCDATCSAVSGE